MQNFISPNFILDDLTSLIQNIDVKVTKRINRLKVIYLAMGKNPNDVDLLPHLTDSNNIDFSETTVLDFINIPTDEYVDTVYLQNNIKDDTLKKTIESLLTAGLNSNLKIYEVSYNLIIRLLKKIENDSRFGPLLLQKKLIPIFKGGLASRLVLLAHYPQYADEIKDMFGFGGDNDCSFMLDPELPNFDTIHLQLIELCHNYLLNISGITSYGIIEQQANKLKSINVNGIKIPVKISEKNSFSIIESGVLKADYTHRKKVFVSRNDTLDYQGLNGSRGKFALVRLKQAFVVGNRVFGAEILDIAIPHKLDDNFVSHYQHFKDGSYITNGKLVNGLLII